MNSNFLIVEDDDLSRINLEQFLRTEGRLHSAACSSSAAKLIAEHKFDMAFLDLDLEKNLAGLDLITPLIESGCYVVILSGREEDETIERAYQLGCRDFISKPFNRSSFDFILKKYSLLSGAEKLRRVLEEDFITKDPTFIEQLKVLNEVVISDRPIYLRGETGTGKTHMARLIHNFMFDSDESFVHLNCSEIPENLLESELFGHEKGAFTGAETKKRGKLELADGGTLFLDEIATMPINTQKKLLRVIEERSFSPLGSEKVINSNFRLISATCENLEGMVADGHFREDLYYRIEGFNIYLKSLRERRDDILALIRHFLRKGDRRIVLTRDTIKTLQEYAWPGNVRELKKLIEMMQSKEIGIISPSELPEKFLTKSTVAHDSILGEGHIYFIRKYGMKKFLEKVEEEVVGYFFDSNGERIRDTLEELKISSSSFYRIKNRVSKDEV